MPSPAVKAFVDDKIKSGKVVVFSKTTCPFCKKAKDAIAPLVGKELPKDQYIVVEINTRSDCQEIQDYLNQLTGARSVPRVFVNGKFIGGGDDTVAKAKSGELKKLLSQ